METLKTALVQADLIWEAPGKNRAYFERVFEALDSDTNLVILPEMFTSGFTMSPEAVYETMDGETVSWMKERARHYGFAIAGSLVIREDGVYRNRFLFVHPHEQVDHYDKRHAFTYAGEHKAYVPGDRRELITYKGWKIFPQVCYDLRFPVFSRNDMDYDLLIYVANWPVMRIDAWDALLKARAIENMAYCIGVNRIGKDANGYEYPGHSGVYDVLGREVVHTTKEEVVYASLEKTPVSKLRNKLGFLKDRDQFDLK
ncbi:amidohydrolase [Robertkochia sediminum]|uniref:amidohydrolase n=1 Tax=Robertkochia sediminum TaxID=2785326 RepID=UPI001933319E|nr:amidohydrolase [Robertkochia sediminum]MBL7471937.1 amidohydrolase [Robertkochia sediminum]